MIGEIIDDIIVDASPDMNTLQAVKGIDMLSALYEKLFGMLATL